MNIKKTIVTKDIKKHTLNKSIIHTYTPIAGDVAVFEVLERGKHETVQSENKRNVAIFEGDMIMAAFADRYATSQFEGYIPEKPTEILDILAGGGAVGIVKSKNWKLKDIEPTKIKLIGYCCDESGKVLNTKFFNKKKTEFNGHIPNNAKIILSIGSTMDSGKTTTAAHIARGLKMGGAKVAFMKFTGTCHTKDKDYVLDCGADIAIDFSDMGFPSTYMCDKKDLLDLYQSLLMLLEPEKPDYIVMEIADGLLERETNSLLRSKEFMNTIYSVIFSSGDSLSAYYGVELLAKWGIHVSFVSGMFTMSPLLIDEVRANLHTPVLTIDEMMTGKFNHLLENQARKAA